jgi:hypothetical protein
MTAIVYQVDFPSSTENGLKLMDTAGLDAGGE